MVSTSSEMVIGRTKYQWPPIQLNLWLLVMMVGSSTVLSIFSSFIFTQRQLRIGIPWYFTYWITVAAISIVFLLIMLWLIAQRQLLPGIVMMGSFILFILWMVGLIIISLQLWGPHGSINSNCQLYIEHKSVFGTSLDTLAWLQQHSVCQAWQAAWAFQLIGCAFLVWIMTMAYQVYKGQI